MGVRIAVLPKGLLKEHSFLLTLCMRCLDMLMVVVAGYGAYFIKFASISVPVEYSAAIWVGAGISGFVFAFAGLYDSVRGKRLWRHFLRLLQMVCFLALL